MDLTPDDIAAMQATLVRIERDCSQLRSLLYILQAQIQRPAFPVIEAARLDPGSPLA
jgi:hypothetical protein